jgi:phenylpropionate dioxygenase-like ring-hydroxylating dioxygenase large terminal subunit
MATLADGRTLPFDWYSDPAVLRLERDRIFRRTWQYAGRADQVAEAGAIFTCDLGAFRSSSCAASKTASTPS